MSVLSLDKAITHCKEKATELKEKAEQEKQNQLNKVKMFNGHFPADYTKANICEECAEEHEQLAQWLIELKAYKACPLMQNECYFCRADRCHNGGQKNENN